MQREIFFHSNITKESRILEFAPYFNPLFPKREGYLTDVIDAFDKTQLVESAKKDPIITDYSKIEDVDYVCRCNYAECIGKSKEYDFIVASHVIEHTTDIIDFLKDCSKLIKDDGVIKLAIPDKRYTFDNFKDITSTRTAIDTHLYRKSANCHSLGAIVSGNLREVLVDGNSTYIPNSAFYYMNDRIFFPESQTENQIESLKDFVRGFNEDKYIDVHSWIVTPKSFEIMMYELNILGFIDLIVDQIFTSPRNIEFLVQIKKGTVTKDDYNKRKELYLQRKAEMLEEFEDAIEIERLMKNVDPETRIYIYGTGSGVDKILTILSRLKIDYYAHIVSDGYRTISYYNDHPVVELSEVPEIDDMVILIGIEKYKDEVIPKLDQRNIRYFFA